MIRPVFLRSVAVNCGHTIGWLLQIWPKLLFGPHNAVMDGTPTKLDFTIFPSFLPSVSLCGPMDVRAPDGCVSYFEMIGGCQAVPVHPLTPLRYQHSVSQKRSMGGRTRYALGQTFLLGASASTQFQLSLDEPRTAAPLAR